MKNLIVVLKWKLVQLKKDNRTSAFFRNFVNQRKRNLLIIDIQMTETFIVNQKICWIDEASHDGASLSFSIRTVFSLFIQETFNSESSGIFFHFWNKLFFIFIKNTQQNIFRNGQVFNHSHILKKQTDALPSVFNDFLQMQISHNFCSIFYLSFILKMSTEHCRRESRFTTSGRCNDQIFFTLSEDDIPIPYFRIFNIFRGKIFWRNVI